MIWLGCMDPVGADTLNVTAQPPAVKAFVDWLECLECDEAQLERLLAHASDVKPLLLAARHEGPTAASREEYRRFLNTTYQQLKQYAVENGQESLMQSEQDYIDMYLRNFETRYKRRAAVALEKISGLKEVEILTKPSQLKLKQ